jgi:hypothetical protein
VFAWGAPPLQSSGTTATRRALTRPALVSSLRGKRVVSVACARTAAVVLSDFAHVHAWRVSTEVDAVPLAGALTSSDDTPSVAPVLQTVAIKGSGVRSVASHASSDNCVGVCNDGSLVRFPVDDRAALVAPISVPSSVTTAVCGSSRVLALSVDGALFEQVC